MAKKILETPSTLKPQPPRGLPRWILVLGAMFVGLGLLVLAAPFFIPWDKVKAKVVEQGTQALGRELSIGSIDLGLLTGVHVKDVRLANAKGAFSAQPLFANADAKVSLSLLSLLTGRVVIDSIRFQKPTLLLETDTGGHSNLESLGGASAPAPATASGGAPAAGATGGFPVLVNEFIIEQGDVIVRDRRKGTETAIHGLDVKLTGISLAAAGASRLEASLTAVVEGKAIPVKLVSDFKLDPIAGSVDIQSFVLTLPALSARLKGTVKGLQQPQADLGLDVEVALDALDQLLPPSVQKSLPPELKTSGRLALALKLKGPLKLPQALQLEGALNFEKVAATYGSYPALSDLQGSLSFDKAGAELPALTLKLGGDPLTLAVKARWGDLGNVTGGAAKLKADVKISLKSPKLNLDPLLAAGSGAKAQDAPAAATAAPAPNGGLSDLRTLVSKGLSLSFDVDVDAVSAQGFKTGKLVERLRLQGQKLSTSTDLDLYQGHLAERSAVDLGAVGPAYRVQLQLQGLALQPLVDDLAAGDPKNAGLQQIKGKVSGRLSLKADLRGKGLDEPARTRDLAGKASFQLADGVIRKTDLQEQLAAAIPDPQTQAVLRGDITFSNAVGEVELAGPRRTLKSFTLGSGSDWRGGILFAQASGTLVKDGPVDLRITPHFNPAQVHVGGDLGKAFEDSRGWPTFDYIAYAGPTQAQAKADFTAGLKKAAVKAVTDQVQKAVQDKAGDALKQLPGLNKLFGQ